jgi:hypothetical protein
MIKRQKDKFEKILLNIYILMHKNAVTFRSDIVCMRIAVLDEVRFSLLTA